MATNEQIKEFIQLFGRLAVNECNNRIAAGKPFILPSVCMAQSALESDWGQAGLMKKANAFFGIKAGGSWTGKVYTADTWEVKDGVAYNTVANFRAYDSPAESMADYYKLTTEASRYANALCYGADKSKWLTPRQTVTALHAAGYATDELYVSKIMNTLNGRNLDEWDNLITGEGVLPDVDITFTIADMLQGKLVSSDSGRSVTNDTSNTKYIALDWEKAYTVKADTTYTVNFNSFLLSIDFIILKDDTVTLYENKVNGFTMAVTAGTKIGFYLSRKETDVNGEPIEDLLIDNSGLAALNVTFKSSLPVGDEVNVNGIAYFIKIE